LAFGLAALATPAFAVNMVTNGSFSSISPLDTNKSDYSIVLDNLVGGTYGTGLPGWTVGQLPANNASPGNNVLDCLVDYSANTANANMCGSAFGGGLSLWQMVGASPDGGNYVMFDALTTYSDPLQQTIGGLTKGAQYTLSFYQNTGEQSGFDAPNGMTAQWNVTFGSQTIGSTVMNTPNHGTNGWVQQTMTFTAGATSQLLSFAATGTPGGGPPMIMLDGVSLTPGPSGQASAPEPATYALVGIGLITFVIGIRRGRARLVAAGR